MGFTVNPVIRILAWSDVSFVELLGEKASTVQDNHGPWVRQCANQLSIVVIPIRELAGAVLSFFTKF